MNKSIWGSEVDLGHEDVKKLKTIADIKKAEIFSHLPKDEHDSACKELMEALKGKPAKIEVEGQE